MKRLIALGLAAAVLVTAAALSNSKGPAAKSSSPDLQVEVEERNPWTNLRINNAPRDFRFAIVSDRTGGHRARVFSKAIERLNLLQPEFVISVGDLIEGYSEEKDKVQEQWKQFDSFVSKLQMPFFYVPGNHDLANPAQVKEWQQRYGRSYYHFVYRNVLFLMLSSEEPTAKEGKISPAQVAHIKKALEANKDVAWTIVSVHKPMWVMADLEKNGWLEVEKVLAGRQYTVFAGHIHRYQKFVRQGMNYYQLATTGGGSKLRGLRYGEFDHITWVTMKKDGPVIANVLLDGVFSESMVVSETEEPGVPTKSRKPVHPCTVKVVWQGKPLSNAAVQFHSYSTTSKKYARVADGFTEADGSVVMSSYTAFDGAPAGDYTMTLAWPLPYFDETGKATPSKLPLRYTKPDTSPLKVTVREGEKNAVEFSLDQ